MTYYEIVLLWPEDTLIQDRDDAALYLDYQDEILDEDQKSPTYGEMVPNPVSKVQTIKAELVKKLQELVVSGAAKRADSARLEAIAAAKLRTANITTN